MDVIERALNGDDVNIVDQYGQTALVYATRKDIIETVELLLDKAADPNMVEIYSRTALMIAIISGSTCIVRLLLDKGADPNIVDTYGQTALISASMYGKRDIVELLLAKGADINIVDKYGRTALLVASEVGPNIVNQHGETAIMRATDRGHTDIVKLIKDKISLQHAIQNLAMAKSMNSLYSPLECLDYDIMKEIMICARTYDHGVHMRMK